MAVWGLSSAPLVLGGLVLDFPDWFSPGLGLLGGGAMGETLQPLYSPRLCCEVW